MKTSFYAFFLLVFALSVNILSAQKKDEPKAEVVTIKAYKNANNKKIDEKVKMVKVLELPSISLFVTYSDSKFLTSRGGGGIGGNAMLWTVDVSDTYWYCLRPGEDVAYMVSWTFNTQVNKNNVFRKNGMEYFKDYPELVNKIDKRELKHDDIFEVVLLYDKWKSGK